FHMRETYGFPLELLEELAVERGMEVDRESLDAEIERGRAISRADRTTALSAEASVQLEADVEFVGYERTVHGCSRVLALLRGAERADALEEGE
ncbi:MAG: alanine--tRNA ligase, partial [Chloroflexota bacterium]